MEELKSSYRNFNVKHQHKQSLTKGYEYYRVRLHSLYKEAGTTNVDATFDVKRVFPNHRADLLNGEWEVFLETFVGDFVDVDKASLTMHLPDLITSPNDFAVGANGCQLSDIVAVVPTIWERLSEIANDGPNAFSVSNVINRDSVGVKIDPALLFQQGQLRVVLTDENLAAIAIGNGAGEIKAAESWQSTLLFVHRK